MQNSLLEAGHTIPYEWRAIAMEEQSLQNTAENTNPVAPEESSEKGSFLSDAAEVLETVLISVFVVIMLFAYVIRPVTVEGRSMNNTLQNGDRLIMTDLFYHPKYGDIVVVDNKKAYLLNTDDTIRESDGLPDEKRLIKRVIATGGQTVDINFNTGVVSVDGKELDESSYAYDYTLDVNTTYATTVDEGAFTYPITVPEDYCFVMGDNRKNSTDSRSVFVGLVPEDSILGKAVFRLSGSGFGSIYENFDN